MSAIKPARFTLRMLFVLTTFVACLNTYGEDANGENVNQQNNIGSPIPVIAGAKVFAQYTDDMPKVVNYFTTHNEQEIIHFYQEKFGDALSSTVKRGRKSLVFHVNEQQLTVIISTQGKVRQVDAILK